MHKNIGLVAIVALLAVGLSVTGAIAKGGKHAPLGYQLMCLQQPAECKGGGKSEVSASKELMATLKRVNARVNHTIRPRYDEGVDIWDASATSGDCEDYVLAKRRQLINAGISANSLRIAYVKTRSGAGHAILVVNTGNGKYVLDNLTNAIRPFSQTGYRVVSMQGANQSSWS